MKLLYNNTVSMVTDAIRYYVIYVLCYLSDAMYICDADIVIRYYVMLYDPV